MMIHGPKKFSLFSQLPPVEVPISAYSACSAEKDPRLWLSGLRLLRLLVANPFLRHSRLFASIRGYPSSVQVTEFQ